ncbi:flagellar export chaperone FlgN [Clostridium paraputrificum]|uniref:flagellar export chaperone FlgN n=1 Tax=Clostridium paraputrificum TaxID=29363 RepID=UPI001897F79D|nr:flagellar export chaperone FlgN [Clostridium paraputrificum]MDB2109419.1 flagellar export chaperone FlgN [Clostridium paraputrificum]
MSNELTIIIKNEGEALKKLLSLLEKQYKHVMKKEVFELEALVDEIKLVNKEVAQAEVERRKLVGKRSMREIVNASNDEELDNSYREINRIILAVKQQKETNELLIRQQMSFNNQILNIINPRREMKTYNSYGNLSR